MVKLHVCLELVNKFSRGFVLLARNFIIYCCEQFYQRNQTRIIVGEEFIAAYNQLNFSLVCLLFQFVQSDRIRKFYEVVTYPLTENLRILVA